MHENAALNTPARNDKKKSFEEAVRAEHELAHHLIAEEREDHMKHLFKKEKKRRKHEEKVNKDVSHEKMQRE